MQLTQANLEKHGSLYAVLPTGFLVGVEPCESQGDIELPLYTNLGTLDQPEWEIQPSVFFALSPYDDLSAVLADCKLFLTLHWFSVKNINFH